MLINILLILGTAAIIKWIVSGDDDEDIEEYSYDRTVRLVHHPSGKIEVDEE